MAEDDDDKCVIWRTTAEYGGSTGGYVDLYSARAGGNYRVTNSAKKILSFRSNFKSDFFVLLTNWLVEQRSQGTLRPVIDSAVLEYVKTNKNFPVTERVERVVVWVVDNIAGLGQTVPIGVHIPNFNNIELVQRNMESICAFTGSGSHIEVLELLDFAMKTGLVDADHYKSGEGGFVWPTLVGFQRVEEIRRIAGVGSQGFVAMWFDDEMKGVYEDAIAPAIREAGFNPMIISNKEHNNQIVEEIIAEIRRSRFVVGDFTCGIVETTSIDKNGDHIFKEMPRGGVYFEAGFAKGLGKEVIWTVRKDRLKYVHFDNAQYNFIVWETLAELKEKLAIRISATLGDGPLRVIN
jgi:hypothetical protein